MALDLIRKQEARVPSIWWSEIRNLLIVNERRGRISEVDTSAFLRELSKLWVTVDRAPEEGGVMALARKHELTVYDACYLELALREACPLAALDKDLIRAARAENIQLLQDEA
jgi:predicted nucleic acid-binding protein